ncbi:MAG: hypothetical protein IJN74_05400 [Clostridia bacterium]|nr:hypothetical protein [Clostridia bacterium]
MNRIVAVLLGIGLLAFIIILLIFVFALFLQHPNEKAADKKRPSDNERPLCPRCKTGKKSVKLDLHSEECPYLSSWKNGECQFFVPLEQPIEK